MRTSVVGRWLSSPLPASVMDTSSWALRLDEVAQSEGIFRTPQELWRFLCCFAARIENRNNLHRVILLCGVDPPAERWLQSHHSYLVNANRVGVPTCWKIRSGR